jgi:hypothetical protein
MMTTEMEVSEHVTRVTPLGFRFWDAVSRCTVTDGLEVTAFQQENPQRRTRAITNRAGVYLLQDMPGLHDAEAGRGDEAYWDNPPMKKTFVVEVKDNSRRFQNFSFKADPPSRGFFILPCLQSDSPPKLEGFIPLYSAPTRVVPAARAVIRAQLLDVSSGKPAAWAVLEARINDKPAAEGFADKEGRVALIFPYPEPSQPSMVSPPSGNRRPLTEQSWPVQVHALYSASIPENETPDLCDVFAQPAAVLMSSLSPPVALMESKLEFGKELVLKSDLESRLFIRPGGSPP